MYIYLDILIITAVYTNYFLIKATAKITHTALKNSKCILSSVIGSLFSLIILLPELNNIILLLIRIVSAAIIIIIAFSGRSKREIYRISLIYFFISFIFAGVEYGLSVLFSSSATVWNNSVLYINISLKTLVISTVISYIAISVFRRFLDSKNEYDGDYVITIINREKTAHIKAVCDTCNNLTDSFSGKPIIVCSKESIKTILNEDELDAVMSLTLNNDITVTHYKGWRLIPYSTINSSGLLPSFLPSYIYIKNNETKKIKYTAAYIGIIEKDMDYAIFNPKILLA